MSNNFKPALDRNMWVATSPATTTHASGGALCSDLRNDFFRNPNVYYLASATSLQRYNIITKSWQSYVNPGISAFAASAALTYAPSRFLNGTITAGATTTSIPTSTSLATTPWQNQFATMGGSGTYGWKIRIIGLATGKTEEKYIVANTATATPTFLLDSPLSFTPSSGDLYEILAGRVLLLGSGAIGATSFRGLDITTGALANLGTTGLPTIGTDSAFMVLDEQYVPYDNNPGEGFIKGSFLYCTNVFPLYALTATGAAAGTLTGQASGGDASVLANEYRNFQIRIVQDTVTPAAVGQRRIIASHTAGASPVYTLGSNWTTTPSSSAKYVIEYPNLVVLRTAANTTVYTYNYGPDTINNGTTSILTNAWSTTYIGVASGNNGAGNIWMPSFAIRPDTQKTARHSYCYFIRGGGLATIDLLDLAGGTAGSWTSTITYENPGSAQLFTTGNCGSLGVTSNQGKYFYINSFVQNQLNQIYRFDVQNRLFVPFTPTDWIQAGAATIGNRLVTFVGFDGTKKMDVAFLLACAQQNTQEIIIQI